MNRSASPGMIAVLGPTNTGKTHLAVERMCAHASGMIGFPLRLLAREVYDRVVALKGENRVALVTGEEKIIPPDARWFLCTVEAMPVERDFSFIALDEAQLAIDPERGHIFTDRLLNARGRDETMILGSESLRPLIWQLLPDAEITTRPRFSTLSYAGPRKLSRLPKRTAVVAFSVEDVYAIAEMLRRQHGGAAIVMGSLSPQTRNAQVKLYQDGEVDYLVATDAIGMGLNLDVSHVAFAALKKFDGRRRRRLTLPEIGQIAGRAGRHQKDGSFGTLSGLSSSESLQPEEIEQLENHDFTELEWLYWRNALPDCESVETLIQSLEDKPRDVLLRAAPEAVDLAVLKRLARFDEISAPALTRDLVRLLWEVASIPDFRKVGPDHQARFAASLWPHLSKGSGRIGHARMAKEIDRLDNVQGDIATLAGRVAAARSWSYIAQKRHWVEQPDEMIERTRQLESRLSDAMHKQLTQRFVDKRTRLLMRGLTKDAPLQDIAVEPNGSVLVDGLEIGTLKGFQFTVPSDSRRKDRKLMLAAAEKILGQIMIENADALAKAPDSVLSLEADSEGRPAIMWGDAKLALLGKGQKLLSPEIVYDRSVKDLSADNAKKVEDRVGGWVDTMKTKHLEGLLKIDALASAAETPSPVRALFTQIVEAGGIVPRRNVHKAVQALDNELRGVARRGGLVFGALDIFHHALMKPGAVIWRNALFAALNDEPMIALPPDNAVHLKDWTFDRTEHATRMGFRKVGEEFVRVDMAEKLVKQAHEARQSAELFAIDDALATSLGLSSEVHQTLLESAGFVKTDETPEPGSGSDRKQETAKPDAAETADTEESEDTVDPAPTVYWRWQGMGGIKSAGSRDHPAKKKHQKGKSKSGKKSRARKPEPVLATAGGAFAELAALKDGMKKPES